MARPNAERTLDMVVNAKDRQQALERLARALGDAWRDGNLAGYAEGVSEANGDPQRPKRNPYRA